MREVAEAVAGVPGYSMPGKFDPGLESLQSFQPGALTYGGACHAVEVEVDVETCGYASCAMWWSMTAAASSIP